MTPIFQDFSTNGQITVQTLDTNFQNIIGRAPGLSFRDIRLANAMYNCAGKSLLHLSCETTFKPMMLEQFFLYRERIVVILGSCPAMNCPGEGFVGKDCKCKCPTNDPNNPIQTCAGTAASTTTTAAPPTSAPTNGMAVYIGKLSIGKLTIKHLSKMLVFYLCNVVSFQIALT